MDVDHIDMIGPLQRSESDRRILQGGDQGELAGQPLAKLLLIASDTGPSRLLHFVVVVTGPLLDRGSKDRGKQGRVLAQERPQAGFGQHPSHRLKILRTVSAPARTRRRSPAISARCNRANALETACPDGSL